MNASRLSIEVLRRGLDDWVYLAGVSSVVIEHLGLSPLEAREPTLELVRELLCDGLMVAGDVTEDGFLPWPLSASEAMERIECELKELGRPPGLGEIAWLQNSPLGQRLAEATLPADDQLAGET